MKTHLKSYRSPSALSLLLVAASLVFTVSTTQAESISGSYTGNASARSIDVGFQPDIVIIKDEIPIGGATSRGMQIRTSTMSFTKSFGQSAAGTTSTDRITALTSTGFSLGTDSVVNSSGIKYCYLAIKTVAGEIAVGTYSGNGADDRNITGVGFQPDFVLTMNSLGNTSTWRTSQISGDESMFWDVAPAANMIQSLLTDGFQVGTDALVNASGGTFHYVACKSVTGKFKVGSYTGTGANQSFTGVGFAPEALFIKRNSTTAGNLRFASTGSSTSADITLQPGDSQYVTNAILSMDTDGFSIGTAGGRVNSATAPNTYHWFAFANATGPTATAPTVTTATQSGVTHNSATLGGNVTADGGDTVSERGIVWGTSASPTTSNNKVQIGSGTGAFSQLVTGLPASTTVHVRAYAINTAGTAYGDNISFTTSATPVAVSSLVRANANPSNAGTVNWTLTFASAVTGVTASNFSLSGAAATGASVGTPSTGNGGISWNVPVSTSGTDGTLTLNLANSTGITPGVSTALPYTGESYTMDKTPPQVLSVNRLTPAGQQTASTTVVFRVTYSEPVVLNAPETARFQVVAVGGSTITGTVASVSGTGNTRDVTVNLTGGTGEFRLRVLD